MLPQSPQQLTLFVKTVKDASYGVSAAWKERSVWKTIASSLGKYSTAADAALFAIDMAMRDLIPILSRADHGFAEIVTESPAGLAAFESAEYWTLPIITDIKRQTNIES